MYTEYRYLTMVVFGPLGWLKADNWSAVSRKGNKGQCLGRDLSQGQGEVWRQELTNISFIVWKRGNALSWLVSAELWRQISSFLLTTLIWSTKFYLFKRKCVLITSLFLGPHAWLSFKVGSKQAQKSSFAKTTKISIFCQLASVAKKTR